MKYVRFWHIPYSIHANSYKHFAKFFFVESITLTHFIGRRRAFFAFWLLNFPFFAGEFYGIFGQFPDPTGWWFPGGFYVDIKTPGFFVGFMDVFMDANGWR